MQAVLVAKQSLKAWTLNMRTTINSNMHDPHDYAFFTILSSTVKRQSKDNKINPGLAYLLWSGCSIILTAVNDDLHAWSLNGLHACLKINTGLPRSPERFCSRSGWHSSMCSLIEVGLPGEFSRCFWDYAPDCTEFSVLPKHQDAEWLYYSWRWRSSYLRIVYSNSWDCISVVWIL